ncbi:MAG: hypothetical protein U9Q71_07260 [Pseudomonadota bacterium]|nr:hypothetical protein [Pseudomonadota bacterium]
MKNIWIAALSACLLLAGCSDDDTKISGGGGGGGDGGSESAKYAGTYKGTVTTKAESSSVGSASDTSDMTLVIHKDGTVTFTVEGESVTGAITGNKFNIPFKIEWSEKLVTCKGNLVVSGTVSGTNISGPVSGTGSCKAAGASTSVKVTGNLSGRKV